MSHDMQLSKKKKDYLESIGFVQTLESEPVKGYKDKLIAMEKFVKITAHNREMLYIHYYEGDSPYCNLYIGSDNDDADVFSARNLISEMQKRQL